MIKRLLFGLFVLLIIMLAFLCISGCNPEKALIRKEDKAFGTVLGSVRIFPKVGAAWLAIHPCVITSPQPDSVTTKHNTITLTSKPVLIPFKVTEYKNRVLDTIIDGVSVYADSNGLVVKNMNEAVITTKTIYKTIVDQTLVDNQRDSINSLHEQQKQLQGYYQATSEKDKDALGAAKKERDKNFWLIIAALGLGVLSHVIRSYIPSMGSIFKKS